MSKVVAENYLFLHALLEMIIKENGNNEFDSVLADYFGINVPLDYISNKITNVKYSMNKSEWGTLIDVESINQFFEMNDNLLYAK